MPVKILEEVDGEILVIDLTGKLTKAEYQQFLPAVERSIQLHGKIRMLVHVHDFQGFTTWEDIQVDWERFAHIERLALVGERAWEAHCKPFTTSQIRYFDRSEADEADDWIYDALDVPHFPGLPERATPAPNNEAGAVC